MKKILLLLVLCAATGELMAQSTKPIEPFDYTFTQPFKTDTLLRNSLANILPDKLFKQEPIDLNKFKVDSNDKSRKALFLASDGYNMPVAKLAGHSNMPVIILEGNSNMPVVGKDMPKAKKATLVTP